MTLRVRACVVRYVVSDASEDVDLAKARLKEMYYNPAGTHAGGAVDTCNTCNALRVRLVSVFQLLNDTQKSILLAYPAFYSVPVAEYRALASTTDLAARCVGPVGEREVNEWVKQWVW